MSRAPRSIAKRRRHKKWLKRAKGFRGTRRTVFKRAKEAVLKSGQYAWRDRRKKKSTRRQTWQIHINAAARARDTTYSRLIHTLRTQHIKLDRKILAQLAVQRPDLLDAVLNQTKS